MNADATHRPFLDLLVRAFEAEGTHVPTKILRSARSEERSTDEKDPNGPSEDEVDAGPAAFAGVDDEATEPSRARPNALPPDDAAPIPFHPHVPGLMADPPTDDARVVVVDEIPGIRFLAPISMEASMARTTPVVCGMRSDELPIVLGVSALPLVIGAVIDDDKTLDDAPMLSLVVLKRSEADAVASGDFEMSPRDTLVDRFLPLATTTEPGVRLTNEAVLRTDSLFVDDDIPNPITWTTPEKTVTLDGAMLRAMMLVGRNDSAAAHAARDAFDGIVTGDVDHERFFTEDIAATGVIDEITDPGLRITFSSLDEPAVVDPVELRHLLPTRPRTAEANVKKAHALMSCAVDAAMNGAVSQARSLLMLAVAYDPKERAYRRAADAIKRFTHGPASMSAR